MNRNELDLDIMGTGCGSPTFTIKAFHVHLLADLLILLPACILQASLQPLAPYAVNSLHAQDSMNTVLSLKPCPSIAAQSQHAIRRSHTGNIDVYRLT